MYYLIFLYAFILSLKTNWLYNNFTYLSYQPNLQIAYLIWITVTIIFLFFKTVKLLQIFYITKFNKLLIALALILILIGSYLPYNPNNLNIYSSFHTIFTSIGAIIYLMIIQIIINRLISINYSFYKYINLIFHGLLTFLIMLIIMFGLINTIIELFYLAVILFTLFKIEKAVIK